ncbi:hypothetical protein CTA1_9439 [Colletotrichum tanaceti]|uniref:Uncharacterized protein n=1 Tax=Colletotrichum tanaceti TaxID=1306861 RepID=A0A4U6WZY3_9PEZI|nr:hypothetical protein CTA1_9439 [Colletotrichum tanaceti]
MGIISSGERVASSPGIVTQDYTASIAQVGTGLVNASKHTVAVTDNAAEAVALAKYPLAPKTMVPEVAIAGG